MANMNFAKKDNKKVIAPKLKSWKILIADDEEDVHALTKTVLKDFQYRNRPLEFISAYSAEETLKIIAENDDIALVLLDVVMESDDAGLKAAKKIRDELHNNIIQIVLRTGQPGSAPEMDVVLDYAINDYKEKTELTSKKLITTIVTSLRTYQTLKSLKATKQGLQQIISASETIYNDFSTTLFTQGILTQIVSLLKLNHDAILVEYIDGLTIEKNNDTYSILDSTGTYEGINRFELLDEEVRDLIVQTIKNKVSTFTDNLCLGYLELDDNHANIIYISSYEKLKQIDKNLIEVFFKHSTVALSNVKLSEDIFLTQKILIEVLGEVVEKRYIDDPHHIKKVAQMSYVLAKKAGLSETEALTLKVVSPMHDVGKIGIPDAILLKPDKLDEQETEVMRTHAVIGYNILKDTHKDTLDMAADVAHEHHERWDGSGYPRGLKGVEISIFARITTIVDVFDALYNKRCYKEAWSMEQITSYYEEQKLKQFDPKLVDLLFENIDEFIEIQNKY